MSDVPAIMGVMRLANELHRVGVTEGPEAATAMLRKVQPVHGKAFVDLVLVFWLSEIDERWRAAAMTKHHAAPLWSEMWNHVRQRYPYRRHKSLARSGLRHRHTPDMPTATIDCATINREETNAGNARAA